MRARYYHRQIKYFHWGHSVIMFLYHYFITHNEIIQVVLLLTKS